jgi:hypothetical protein
MLCQPTSVAVHQEQEHAPERMSSYAGHVNASNADMCRLYQSRKEAAMRNLYLTPKQTTSNINTAQVSQMQQPPLELSCCLLLCTIVFSKKQGMHPMHVWATALCVCSNLLWLLQVAAAPNACMTSANTHVSEVHVRACCLRGCCTMVPPLSPQHTELTSTYGICL